LIEKIIIGSLGIFLTALFSSIIPRKHKEQERFNIAYDAFKSSFNPTIQTIEKSSKVEADYVAFPGYFADQDAAEIAFRNNLAGKRLRRFNEKWAEYKQHQKRYTEEYEMCVVNIRFYGEYLKSCILELLVIAKKHWYDL
jgi:hypothetical protein